ncbi:MAG: AI-2E family transporter, partial [Atopobiaceae bacterium]|nr:AI-2E family transporter [Atopobiaceae bacterium]
IMGLIVGFICTPITNALEDRGVKRTIAALIAVLVVILAIIAILAILLPPLVNQTVALLQQMPAYSAQVREGLNQLWTFLGDFADENLQTGVSELIAQIITTATELSRQLISALTTGLIPNIRNAFSNAAVFLLSLILAYWLTLDYPRILREVAIIVGPEHRDEFTLLLAVTSRSMGGYMQGTIINSIVVGVGTALGLLITGHPYPMLMGVATGILHIIPVVGSWISTIAAVLLGFLASPITALWALVVIVVVSNLTGNVISPLVMQSAVSVHPALSLVAIFVGASLGGIIGMILAIPLSAAIKAAFVYYFETRTGRQLVSYEGAFFRGTPFHDDRGNIVPSSDALDDDKFFETTRISFEGEAPIVQADERPVDMPATVREVLQQRLGELRGVSDSDTRSTRLNRAHRARHSLSVGGDAERKRRKQ